MINMADIENANVVNAEAQEQKKERKSAPSRVVPKKRSRPEVSAQGFSDQLLFGRYSLKDIAIEDLSIAPYINMRQHAYPNIFGRRKDQSYYNSHINIVERLINKLMRGGTGKKVMGKVIRTEGRLQGRKLKATHIVEDAFSAINEKTGRNPVQVFVESLENAAPIEDVTRVRYGGINYNVAVGISSKRRLDVALRNIALAALIGGFNKKRSVADSLASEIMLAATNSQDSYAIKKRQEVERIAKRAR
jgi:small subunit ribosomal protein S7